jgi:hypothetical protein
MVGSLLCQDLFAQNMLAMALVWPSSNWVPSVEACWLMFINMVGCDGK